VETELEDYAAGQQPAVEKARVAKRIAIDPDEPEKAAGVAEIRRPWTIWLLR
jgi:hypothetical protein